MKKHRENVALSRADYAALVGVSPQTIYLWENGTTRPQAKQRAAWCAVRGLSLRQAGLDLMDTFHLSPTPTSQPGSEEKRNPLQKNPLDHPKTHRSVRPK